MGRVSLVGAGSVLGELAFFDSGPRSAGAWAVDDCEVAAMTPDQYTAFEQSSPALAREHCSRSAGFSQSGCERRMQKSWVKFPQGRAHLLNCQLPRDRYAIFPQKIDRAGVADRPNFFVGNDARAQILKSLNFFQRPLPQKRGFGGYRKAYQPHFIRIANRSATNPRLWVKVSPAFNSTAAPALLARVSISDGGLPGDDRESCLRSGEQCRADTDSTSLALPRPRRSPVWPAVTRSATRLHRCFAFAVITNSHAKPLAPNRAASNWVVECPLSMSFC